MSDFVSSSSAASADPAIPFSATSSSFFRSLTSRRMRPLAFFVAALMGVTIAEAAGVSPAQAAPAPAAQYGLTRDPSGPIGPQVVRCRAGERVVVVLCCAPFSWGRRIPVSST